MEEKARLRQRLRRQRREHVAALPENTLALMFFRPPSSVAAMAAEGATIGFYHARGAEAPTLSYAKWFHEHGHPLALPWFAGRDAPMRFRTWNNPFDEEELEPGPFGFGQPRAQEAEVVPDIIFVPVIGFTADGDRLGQGGGHYDRWLAENPGVTAIGLAWDCQLVENLPRELHDCGLRMVVTPTRAYEGTL